MGLDHRQTFIDNIYFAKPEDFRKATHRFFLSADHPTRLKLGVLPTTSRGLCQPVGLRVQQSALAVRRLMIE